MVDSIGYSAYGSLPIQQKLTGQEPQVDTSSKQADKAGREELFRSLLKDNAGGSDDARQAAAASPDRTQADASQGRGRLVDVNV